MDSPRSDDSAVALKLSEDDPPPVDERPAVDPGIILESSMIEQPVIVSSVDPLPFVVECPEDDPEPSVDEHLVDNAVTVSPPPVDKHLHVDTTSAEKNGGKQRLPPLWSCLELEPVSPASLICDEELVES